MRVDEVKIIGSVLGREIGLAWPFFLLKSLRKGNQVFNRTSWARNKRLESAFAKRISFSSGMYLLLKERYGESKAFEIMRQVLVPIGLNEQLRNLESLDVVGEGSMDRLKAFYDFMGKGGVGQFVERKLTESNKHSLKYKVRGCLFDRFYREAGTPELTKLFCEVDTEFFPKAFPDFKFYRGDTFENTVAFGRDHCDFMFELRDDRA